jgi:hypothetical protein
MRATYTIQPILPDCIAPIISREQYKFGSSSSCRFLQHTENWLSWKMHSSPSRGWCVWGNTHAVMSITVSSLQPVGGQNWPWVFGTLFYKGVRFERGENWFHKTQVFHFLLFFICHYSIQYPKKLLGWENYGGGGAFAPRAPPPQITPMVMRPVTIETTHHMHSLFPSETHPVSSLMPILPRDPCYNVSSTAVFEFKVAP